LCQSEENVGPNLKHCELEHVRPRVLFLHVQLDRHHELANKSKNIEKHEEDAFIAVPLLDYYVPDEVVDRKHHQKCKQNKKTVIDDRLGAHI